MMKQFLKSLWLWLLLKLGGRNIKLATSWNELSARQLEEIAVLLERFYRFKDTYPDRAQPALFSKLYVSLVKNLLRTNNMIKVWVALHQIPPEEYREHVDFLLKEVTRTTFPEAFKIKGKTFYPPNNRLNNITIREFSFVDAMFYNWDRTNDTRYLDLLCAGLYRRADHRPVNEVDLRKPFNKILVENDVALVSKLSQKKKLAIAYTYRGCRNYIAGLYPHVFPVAPKKTEEELKAQGKDAARSVSKEPKYVPFGQLLQHKIEFDPSKLETTQQLNVHEFLSTYENELKEIKKTKK